MIEEKEKDDLESLSHAWSERVKGIRQMAKNREPSSPDAADAAVIPTDHELFAGAVHEDLSVQDIFVGDEDFYKTMDNTQPADTVRLPAAIPTPKIAHKRLPFIPKILIGGILLTVLVVLLYGVFLNLSSLRLVSLSPKADSQQTGPVKSEPENHPQQNQDSAFLVSPEQPTSQPVSLRIAQDYYLGAEYPQAYAVYKQLLQNLPQTASNDALRHFLQLNMALCMEKANRKEQSAELLRTVSQSCSPAVRVLANYSLCLLEMEKKQFLAARTKAYQAIGLLDAIDFNADWSQELRRNCYFLATEAVSREALSLADADKELPPQLWPCFDVEEALLADLNEEELLRVLTTGTQQLSKSLLGPTIQEETGGSVPYWTMSCNGASIGELMSRFSANSGYDVRWGMDSNRNSLRDRSVSLYLTAVDNRHFVTVTAGCAGLLAYFDENNIITICNPTEYSCVSEQVSLLSAEAVSCWQRYLLTFYKDPYLANAHFALGLLKAQQGLVAESLAEYKMVSGHYSNSVLEPGALTCSAKLKTDLHDYQGAYDDLKEVVEQYPDHEQINQTCLSLADAAERIGRDDEAAKLYCKIYYLNSSLQAQSAAALAAGKIFYKNQNFADAEKWLTQYIDLVGDNKDQDLYQGCLLLGKTWLALDNTESACDALRVALLGRLTQQDYVETVTALAEGYMQQEYFVEALQILNDTSSRQLSQAESVQMLLLKSHALRGMGLIDKAVALLTEREEYMIDDRLKVEIGYELSECYIEQGQLNLAYKKLAGLLEGAGSGPVGHKTAFRLADVCSQLELNTQALRVGSELLSLHPSQAMEQKTLELLASVYHKQKNYDRAALVLMGQWE